MVSCREEDCSETFEDEKHMEVHFSKQHDNSAKEKSLCEECGEIIEYYPSAKSGKYCSKCQKERPWETPNNKYNPELPEEYEEKAYSEQEITQRENDLPTIIRGDVSEIEVKKKFKQECITVCEPITDNAPYDIVIQIDNEFLRVQIKTGKFTGHGSVTFDIDSVHTNSSGNKRKRYEGKIDLFAVCVIELDEVFIVPISEINNAGINLRYKLPKRKGNYNWARDYTIKNMISKLP